MELDTPRFRLCSLGPEDVSEDYQGWMADPALMTPMNRPAQRRTREELARYVAGFDNRHSFHLGVFERDEDRLIGVYSIHCHPVSAVAETHVVLGDRNWWGRRVILETRTAILDFLFREAGVEKVVGRPFSRNIPAVANYNALGFRCEGIMRSQAPGLDGSRLDQYFFGLLRDEWLEKRGATGE